MTETEQRLPHDEHGMNIPWPTPVGVTLNYGSSVPADVTKLRDNDGDTWTRDLDGMADTWTCTYQNSNYAPAPTPHRERPDPTYIRQTVIEVAMRAPCQLAPWCPAVLPGSLGHRWSRRHGAVAWCDGATDERPANDEPMILGLPVVPPGTNRLVTVDGGNAWVRHGVGPAQRGTWKNETTHEVLSLANLLQEYGAVRVENREPRTWPKLDGAPDDVRAVKGKSSTIYVRSAHPLVRYAGFVSQHNAGAERESLLSASLSHWQEVDGPLTEVFDVPETPAPWETQ